MNTTKLEKLYLQYRFPALICLSTVVVILISSNQWIEHQYRNAQYPTWTVGTITAGNTFTVTNDIYSKTRTIKLCGITPAHPESKAFLKSVVDQGNGSIELEQAGDTHEAWVMLKPEFESQIHVNTYMVEKGMAKLDLKHSKQCRSREEIEIAEKLAKEQGQGIWGL